MAEWIKVGQLTDIPRNGALVLDSGKGPVAVFRTNDDSLFALDDRCPHKEAPLSTGHVQGRQVTCPWHQWDIDLGTGEACPPFRGRTACHAVKIEDGLVWLQAAC